MPFWAIGLIFFGAMAFCGVAAIYFLVKSDSDNPD